MTPFATRGAPTNNNIYAGKLISDNAPPIDPPLPLTKTESNSWFSYDYYIS